MTQKMTTTEPSTPGAALSEPFLGRQLVSMGLAVEYVRAEGNTLYRRGEDGAQTPVLDLVGGFGATILGHHHPDITAYAKALLDAGTPVHAQFSLHPYAEDVAHRLNTILRRELGVSEQYSVIFANSGAEAVEAALKHAELDRTMRIAAIQEDIARHVEAARAAVGDGAVLSPDARDALGAGTPLHEPDTVALDRLIRLVTTANTGRADVPPVFLAVEGSFHGKLVGSVQLTHNPAVRVPFRALAAQCRFVPADRPEALAAVVERERRTLLDLTVADGVVDLTERDLPHVCAFVLEPIQGEGGIRPISEEFAARVRSVCAEIGCPVIVDEVQSGMGRTGAFLASAGIGLRGDYYVLAKSLGGGLAKTAVLLVRASRYRPEFEMMHSSTFAKDGFSTRIAGRTLDLLEADGGALYRLATELGERFVTRLEGIRDDFEDVIKEVRGKGLMIGVEFHDQSAAGSPAVREYARAGVFGYVAAGYLLRAHALRVFPTASATHTLRIEPSVQLTDAEMDHAESGLRALCHVLRTRDEERLLGG